MCVSAVELKQQMPVVLVLLYTVGAAVLLIILTYLLIHCERFAHFIQHFTAGFFVFYS